MTEPSPTDRSAARPRRPSLYRTLLGVAVAALLAAWLPFSILYINALTNHAVTAAKAGAILQPASSGTGQPAHTLTPVTTRASGAPVP